VPITIRLSKAILLVH